MVEYNSNDKSLLSVSGSVTRAAARTGVKASPYVLRHTAGVWMAEAGVPMEEIAQYMGHTDIDTTRKHYARFSPQYLQRAAGALRVLPIVPPLRVYQGAGAQVVRGSDTPDLRNTG